MVDLDDFQREVAGLPAWGWGVAIGGGLIVANFVRSRNKAPAAETPGRPTPTYLTEGPMVSAGSVITALGGGSIDTSGFGTGTVAPPTEAEWEARAVAILVKRGISATRAHSLIQRYLSGGQILESEAVVLNELLAVSGIPPWTIPQLNIVPDPSPTQAVVPQPAPAPAPAPAPTVVPAPAPMTDHERFLAQAQEYYDRARHTNSVDDLAAKWSAADFERMAWMGFRSSDPNLNPFLRFFYGAWLKENGRTHLF